MTDPTAPVLSTPAGTAVPVVPPEPRSREEGTGDEVVELVYDQPMGTYGVSICSIAEGGSVRLVVDNDWEESPVVVGRLNGADPEALIGPAVALALATNGTAFGVELMGSLPTQFENHRPDLLPAAVVEESLLAFVERSVEAGRADSVADPLTEDLGTDDDHVHVVRRYMATSYEEPRT